MRVDIRKDVGARIRALRQARGFSQETLAERADLHRNYVGSIERGERDVGLSSLVRLTTALGLSLADFFAPFHASGRQRRT